MPLSGTTSSFGISVNDGGMSLTADTSLATSTRGYYINDVCCSFNLIIVLSASNGSHNQVNFL